MKIISVGNIGGGGGGGGGGVSYSLPQDPLFQNTFKNTASSATSATHIYIPPPKSIYCVLLIIFFLYIY